jgi:hypothetical protein
MTAFPGILPINADKQYSVYAIILQKMRNFWHGPNKKHLKLPRYESYMACINIEETERINSHKFGKIADR